MARNEKTSKRIGSIAARAMRDPASLTLAEIRSLGASATTQMPDRKKSKKKTAKNVAKKKARKPAKRTVKKTAKKASKKRAKRK